MLTSLHIKNFKAWRDTGPVRLAPLTVIFGANSAGKSSLGHLLLALKQTAMSTDRKRPLHLGDKTTLVDLGTFSDCLFGHDPNNTLEFELAWKLEQTLHVKNPVEAAQQFSGNEMSLSVAMSADKSGQPEVGLMRYRLANGGAMALEVEVKRNEGPKRQFDLATSTRSEKEYTLTKALGRAWPIEEPEKFYRLSDKSLARYVNAGFLTDFALATESILGSVAHLGPLREPPERIYQWSGQTPEGVGQVGGSTIAAILAAKEDGRRLNRGPKRPMQPFDEFIASWLKDLGVIHSFVVAPVSDGRKDYEVLVKTHAQAAQVKITDVGFGVSQVLPALVEAFYCPPNSTVWMEQPEIHLHPQVQAELADVFISAIHARQDGKERNVQLIIESHSEHFLNRLQRRIAEQVISPKDVAAYFCKRSSKGVELEPLEINLFGEIENWPENFFGDEMADLTGRVVAAAKFSKESRQ